MLLIMGFLKMNSHFTVAYLVAKPLKLRVTLL